MKLEVPDEVRAAEVIASVSGGTPIPAEDDA